jgi:replicative DNA helicase
VPPEPPRVRSFDELLDAYADERSRPGYEPIKLGFGSLDADMRGVSPGQVLGIAARTAVGKTWALNTITHNVAPGGDTGTLVLSLEMPGASGQSGNSRSSRDFRIASGLRFRSSANSQTPIGTSTSQAPAFERLSKTSKRSCAQCGRRSLKGYL